MSEGSNTDTSLLLCPLSSPVRGGGQMVVGDGEALGIAAKDEGGIMGGSCCVSFTTSDEELAHFNLVWWKNACWGQSGSGGEV